MGRRCFIRPTVFTENGGNEKKGEAEWKKGSPHYITNPEGLNRGGSTKSHQRNLGFIGPEGKVAG